MQSCWKWGCLSSIAISLYCALFNKGDLYDYIFLLPLVYSIAGFFFFISVHRKCTYGMDLVYAIAHMLLYLRYVITPFFTVFSSYFTSWGWGPDPTKSEITIAIILMCIEECLIFGIQYYAIRHFSSKAAKKRKLEVHKNSRNERYWLLILYAFAALALVLLVRPELLIKESYFAYTATTSSSDEVAFSGMYTILADTFKKVFLIIGLILCKRGYDRKKNQIYLVMAVIAVVINMALNTGGTRIRMLFSLILGIYFLNYIFEKIPRWIYVLGGVLCVFSFFSVSVYKFSYALSGNSNPIAEVLVVMMGQFQDYFAGPRLVGQMFGVERRYGELIGISTFFNDFWGSVPFISNFVDQTNRINYYFNIYCGTTNQTLIAPILGIGYCYLPIFPFFLSMLFEYMVIKLDYLMRMNERVKYKYLYAYMGYVCAMCMGYSTQNIYAQFVNAFIPLLVLFKINDKVILSWGNRSTHRYRVENKEPYEKRNM